MRRLVLVPILLLVAGLAPPLLAPAPASAASTDVAGLEAEVVRLVNDARREHDLPALDVTVQQQRKAREHSAVMAERDELHHAPDLADDVFPGDAWLGMAENVVRRMAPETAHRAFMDSPPHRANILDEDWTHVGVGIAVDGDDLWVTQRFITVKSGRTLPLFRDMPSGGWQHGAILEAWRSGLLQGCGRDRACPEGQLTRAQMATLLARITDRDPDALAARRFGDVHPDSTHAAGIGALAAAGVTRGCRDDAYCPGEPLSRGAMASLILRSNEWAGLLARRFADVAEDHTHSSAINRIAERGVTKGCEIDRYCPQRPISRVETVQLLSRAF